MLNDVNKGKYMTPENFCYWLQGYFELRDNASVGLDVEQIRRITDHLDLVFVHEAGKVTDPTNFEYLNMAQWPAISC